MDLAVARRNRQQRPACIYDIRPLSHRREQGGRRYLLSSESELRVRSYVVFHRIYEAMALGMHPASLYPRRNRVAPMRCARGPRNRETNAVILRAPRHVVKLFSPLELLPSMCLTSGRADMDNAWRPPDAHDRLHDL
jgi:hypothetical protein